MSTHPTTDPGTVLDEVAALGASGRWPDAIERLSAAVRATRDEILATQLVALRHRAYIETERPHGRSDWPPVTTDPCPDIRNRPPEIEAPKLDGDSLGGALQHHGCVLIRGLLSTEASTQLSRGVESGIAAHDAWHADGEAPEGRPGFRPFTPQPPYKWGKVDRNWVRKAGAVWAAECPLVFFDLLDGLNAAGTIDAISGYLGERPALSVNKFTLRRIGTDSQAAWHQDGTFLGSDVRAVNVWIALTDCGDDLPVPGLDVVPRRIPDILPTGTHGSWFPNSVGPELVDEVRGEAPITRLRVSAGDVLIFDERFLHSTGVSPGMTTDRLALETWFFSPSAFPRGYLPLLV